MASLRLTRGEAAPGSSHHRPANPDVKFTNTRNPGADGLRRTAVSNDVVAARAAHRGQRAGPRKPAAGRKRKQSVTSRRASTSSVVSTSARRLPRRGRARSTVAGGLHNHRKSRLTADAAALGDLLDDLDSIGGSDRDDEDDGDTRNMRMTRVAPPSRRLQRMGWQHEPAL